MALSVTPAILQEQDLAPATILWEDWLKKVLAKDPKRAHLWWSRAKEIGWFSSSLPLFLAEGSMGRDAIFLKELLKETLSDSWFEIARLLKTYLQQAIDHPVNFNKKEKQLELLDIIQAPLLPSLFEKEVPALRDLLVPLTEKVFSHESLNALFITSTPPRDLFCCVLISLLLPKIKKLPTAGPFVDQGAWVLKALREADLKAEQSSFWKEVQKRHLKLAATECLAHELKALLANAELTSLECAELFAQNLPLLHQYLSEEELKAHFEKHRYQPVTLPKESLELFLELLLASQMMTLEAWQSWFQSMLTLDHGWRNLTLIDKAWNQLIHFSLHSKSSPSERQGFASIWAIAIKLLPSLPGDYAGGLLDSFSIFLEILKEDSHHAQMTLLFLFKKLAENLKNTDYCQKHGRQFLKLEKRSVMFLINLLENRVTSKLKPSKPIFGRRSMNL